MDVDDEIYILQNCGSVSVAKEYVPAQLLSFAKVERDPQRLVLHTTESLTKHPECPSPRSSPRKRGDAEQSPPTQLTGGLHVTAYTTSTVILETLFLRSFDLTSCSKRDGSTP
jgi:hypothetical protein